eukprot:11337222-Ditylum_brightwellii.AAC.1
MPSFKQRGLFKDNADDPFEGNADGGFDRIDTDTVTGTSNGAPKCVVGEANNESSNGDTERIAACSRSASLSFMNDRYEFIAPSSVIKLEKSLIYLS